MVSASHSAPSIRYDRMTGNRTVAPNAAIVKGPPIVFLNKRRMRCISSSSCGMRGLGLKYWQIRAKYPLTKARLEDRIRLRAGWPSPAGR